MKKDYWTKKEWITTLSSEPCVTCEGARQAFVDLIKDMDGVTVINDKRGIKIIEVRSEYKLYKYEVHAETVKVKIGEIEVTEDEHGFTGEGSYMEDVCVQMYIGKVSRNIYNAKL